VLSNEFILPEKELLAAKSVHLRGISEESVICQIAMTGTGDWGLVHIGGKGLPVFLNEPAGDVKDLSFGNERSFPFAGAQGFGSRGSG
jgi:hypothetical protein